MSNKLSIGNKCHNCKQQRSRNNLGIYMENMHVYCIKEDICGNPEEHPGADNLTSIDPAIIKDQVSDSIMKRLVGKSISFRLPPHLALHFAKMIQQEGHPSINAAIVHLIEQHQKENDYSDVRLLKTDEEQKVKATIENEFIKPKEPTEAEVFTL